MLSNRALPHCFGLPKQWDTGGKLAILTAATRTPNSLQRAACSTFYRQRNHLGQFRSLLERADTVEKLTYHEPSEDAFLAAGRRVVENSDLFLAVWDGQPAKGKGGTADIVEYARNRGSKVEVIWPSGMKR